MLQNYLAAGKDAIEDAERRMGEVIELLKEIKAKNDSLQNETEHDSEDWHAHETIDDKIYEALRILGD